MKNSFLIKAKIIIINKTIQIIVLMSQRSYLTNHPDIFKKNVKNSVKESKIEIDNQQLARQLIEDQSQRIKDIKFQIQAYKIKIDQEKQSKMDYSKQIQELQDQLQDIRNQQKDILVQIQNCRQVQNHVNPLEYYLWKKKQRINTYDASIAQLYREIQAQREYFERSLQQYRRENEDLMAQIQDLEEKIVNFGNMPKDEDNQQGNDQQHMNELFGQNIVLKQQYNALLATAQIISQNRQIIGLQVADNIQTIQYTLRSYFEEQKAKLSRQFKQIQIEIKSNQVVPINRQDQSYNIEPLFDDYTYKLKELQNLVPQSMKKVVHPVLVPLPWASFNWREFLGTNKNSQQIYNEFNQLQQQCIKNQGQALHLQTQIKKINGQIVIEQQKSNEISINILKLKKKLNLQS